MRGCGGRMEVLTGGSFADARVQTGEAVPRYAEDAGSALFSNGQSGLEAVPQVSHYI